MQMNVEIRGGAKALDEGHRAGLRLGMGQAGVVDHEGREGAVNDLQHRGKPLRLGREQMPQGDRTRDHPLAHGHVRDHLLHQMGGSLGHASGATGRAKPAAFTGEGHQLLMGAVPTSQAQNPVRSGLAKQYLPIFASQLQAILSRSSLAKSSTWALLRLQFCSLRSTQSNPNLGANSGKVLFREPSDPAFQKRLELVFDKLGQACSGFLFDLSQEGVDVILDHLVERGLFGTAAFVGSRGVIGWSRARGLGARATAR